MGIVDTVRADHTRFEGVDEEFKVWETRAYKREGNDGLPKQDWDPKVVNKVGRLGLKEVGVEVDDLEDLGYDDAGEGTNQQWSSEMARSMLGITDGGDRNASGGSWGDQAGNNGERTTILRSNRLR